jgi:hypothetical protein
MKELKENDIYFGHYKYEYTEKFPLISTWNHCFEGKFIVKKVDGKLMFFDTFWSTFGGNGGKTFTEKEASEKFNLTYKGNLDDYNLKKTITPTYYDEVDYILLTHQHACWENCKFYYLKKGATKSKEKMKQEINKKIEDAIFGTKEMREKAFEQAKQLFDEIDLKSNQMK